jgi:hypothetical protein
MVESDFNRFEKKLEHIPTLEEVHLVFKELAKKEYKETRQREDEKGLYLLEIVVPGDSENETIEYAYMRKGQYKEGQSSATEIHVTYYDDGMPISGTSAARCVDGDWKIL